MQRDRNGLSPRHGTYSPGSPGVGDRVGARTSRRRANGISVRCLFTAYLVLYAKGTLPSICSERVSAGVAVE